MNVLAFSAAYTPRAACGTGGSSVHQRHGLVVRQNTAVARSRGVGGPAAQPSKHRIVLGAATGFRGPGPRDGARYLHRVCAASGLAASGDFDDPSTGRANNEDEVKRALVSMARVHNLLPSCLLVFVGAFCAGAGVGAVVTNPYVWLMALCSGSIAIGSVVVNDYFDFRSGVDIINSPTKPLPSGIVAPDYAVLFSSLVYIGSLIAACLMEGIMVRGIVAASVFATIIYTPVLKRITLVKNMTCAGIIAASPVAGALVAGAGGAGMARVLGAAAFAFCGVMFREILMDISDTDGDRDAGIPTLPVTIGKSKALMAASGFLVLGAACAATAVSGSGMLAGLATGLRYIISSLAGGTLAAPLLLSARDVWTSGFDHDVMSQRIDASFGPIGLGLIILSMLR